MLFPYRSMRNIVNIDVGDNLFNITHLHSFLCIGALWRTFWILENFKIRENLRNLVKFYESVLDRGKSKFILVTCGVWNISWSKVSNPDRETVYLSFASYRIYHLGFASSPILTTFLFWCNLPQSCWWHYIDRDQIFVSVTFSRSQSCRQNIKS